MPILLFLLWMLFNERLTLDVIIVGIIVVVALSFFLYKIGAWDPGKDAKTIMLIPDMIAFVIRLIYEVFVANFHMIALVLSKDPNARIQPKILKHYVPIKTRTGRVALANSITLTPGTVTVDVGDDYVYVHAIDEHAQYGLIHSVPQKKIENMEKKL